MYERYFYTYVRVCYYMCVTTGVLLQVCVTACALISYIWGRLVLDRLFDVRFLTRVFGWGMSGWRGRAGLWGRWEGLLIKPTGFCGSTAGLWGLTERELNFFFPPSSESERSSSVRKTVLNEQQPTKTIWGKYALKRYYLYKQTRNIWHMCELSFEHTNWISFLSWNFPNCLFLNAIFIWGNLTPAHSLASFVYVNVICVVVCYVSHYIA